jgi:hypothetical protein
MACTFVGVKGDFWTKRAPIRLPKAHTILKETSYLSFHPLKRERSVAKAICPLLKIAPITSTSPPKGEARRD